MSWEPQTRQFSPNQSFLIFLLILSIISYILNLPRTNVMIQPEMLQPEILVMVNIPCGMGWLHGKGHGNS